MSWGLKANLRFISLQESYSLSWCDATAAAMLAGQKFEIWVKMPGCRNPDRHRVSLCVFFANCQVDSTINIVAHFSVLRFLRQRLAAAATCRRTRLFRFAISGVPNLAASAFAST